MLKEKIFKICILVLFIMSCPFLTFIISNGEDNNLIFIGCIISEIFAIYIGIKYLKNVEYDVKTLFISLLIAIYTDKTLGIKPYTISVVKKILFKIWGLEVVDTTIIKILSIMTIPALTIFVYFFIKLIIVRVKEEIVKFSKIEKIYLIVSIVVGLSIATIIGHYTTAFYVPYTKENKILCNYDVIYTSDNGIIVGGDAYANINHPENDIRQPLFGFFALPFGVIGHFFSELFFFLPKASYAILMASIQFILIAIIIIMLARMLKINEKYKGIFYLLFLVSAPYLVFSFCLEQYVIGLFYVVLTIYMNLYKEDEVNYSYIGATGTLLTSGVLFPLISKSTRISKVCINILKCFIVFVAITCIGGQFPQFANVDKINVLLNNYSGSVSAIDKIRQFLVFVKSTLFLPRGEIILDGSFYAYRLVQPEYISKTGICILLFVIFSFIINHKEKFAKVCLLWVFFSVFILAIIGWGAYENGMILYSLYFSWAYVCLIYMGINKIIKNHIAMNICISGMIIFMLVVNIPELVNIIKFALLHY